ncbi:hypothetical protein T06_2421 [Trichinella sp. T6]|nr:hypothetical protein T06_2421 [Trichinella sp. T6]KRZ89342.1 hypothetical protein T08_12038 [Trichinella sp. T8]
MSKRGWIPSLSPLVMFFTFVQDIQVGNATKCRIVYTRNKVASEDGSNPTLDEHRDVDQDAPARKATVAMVECTFRVLRAI